MYERMIRVRNRTPAFLGQHPSSSRRARSVVKMAQRPVNESQKLSTSGIRPESVQEILLSRRQS